MLNYGVIGNCATCALINKEAAIEWLCYPDFSSPSIFAKILDQKKGGQFSIIPSCTFTSEQKYIKNTNVLETTFSAGNSAFRVIDFFPRYKKLVDKKRKILKANYLVRLVEPIKGSPKIRILFDPRPNYAQDEISMKIEAGAIVAESKNQKILLASNAHYEAILSGEEIELNKSLFFALGEIEDASKFNLKRCRKLMHATKRYWLHWVSSRTYPNENKELIIRSALVLKLLTYSKTGAIVAAATTSIPEEIGSDRCFDYRYCWVRDSAYTIDALTKIGCFREAKRFIDFILQRLIQDDHIQIMYGINGETRLTETIIPSLDGFEGSKPVRIGNAAYSQNQHDIYGEMIDVLYLFFTYYQFEAKMTKKYWRFLEWLVNQIRFNWDKRDSGIWEFRGKNEHFTYSKLMCFIGIDRAIKIAQHYRRDELSNKWLALRDEIRTDILKNGYDEKMQAFTMYYGSKNLDASLLHMTYHEFLEPKDPRIINTVKSIYESLRHDHLVQRYDSVDDFGKPKSSFTICSFWLVDALVYIGEIEKAKEIFQKLIKSGNHLGLFSEDIDLATGRLLGNFPQAYTHIAMINTSILLSEWSAKRKKIDWTTVRRDDWF